MLIFVMGTGDEHLSANINRLEKALEIALYYVLNVVFVMQQAALEYQCLECSLC